MRMIDGILAEMEMEAKTTRKFLEALPADQMGWKPHEKSMTAGDLANHVATIPGHLTDWCMKDEFSMGNEERPKVEHTKTSILKNFEDSIAHATTQLKTLGDEKMMANWKFQMNGKTMMEMPRMVMIRSFIMNHMYHHRGQLGVYLRLLGAKVPASYGPSADDNPMAAMMEGAASGQR